MCIYDEHDRPVSFFLSGTICKSVTAKYLILPHRSAEQEGKKTTLLKLGIPR